MPDATYDPEADALYVRLRDDEQPETQEFLDDLRILDYSAGGAVVGVEFIAASAGIDLSGVPFVPRVEELIAESGHSSGIVS